MLSDPEPRKTFSFDDWNATRPKPDPVPVELNGETFDVPAVMPYVVQRWLTKIDDEPEAFTFENLVDALGYLITRARVDAWLEAGASIDDVMDAFGRIVAEMRTSQAQFDAKVKAATAPASADA